MAELGIDVNQTQKTEDSIYTCFAGPSLSACWNTYTVPGFLEPTNEGFNFDTQIPGAFYW